MNKEIRDKMERLAGTRALADLHHATKVLYRDLAFGEADDEFTIDDIRAFITTKVFLAVVEAAEDGPPKAENEPTLVSAVNFVRLYVRHGYKRKVAEGFAISLYNLSGIGIRMLKAATL